MTDFPTLVSRHRDFASPTLTVDWALLRLLDEQGSQLLQDDLRENCHPWEVLTVTEHAWEVIPEQPGLYVFVWRPWFKFDVAENRRPGDLTQVLYVGKAGADDQGRPSSGNLRQRYRSYLKHIKADPADLWGRTEPRTRLQFLDRYLALRPLEYWFTVVPDHQHVPVLEDRLIKVLNPPCNKQRAPKINAKFKPAVQPPRWPVGTPSSGSCVSWSGRSVRPRGSRRSVRSLSWTSCSGPGRPCTRPCPGCRGRSRSAPPSGTGRSTRHCRRTSSSGGGPRTPPSAWRATWGLSASCLTTTRGRRCGTWQTSRRRCPCWTTACRRPCCPA